MHDVSALMGQASTDVLSSDRNGPCSTIQKALTKKKIYIYIYSLSLPTTLLHSRKAGFLDTENKHGDINIR